MPLANTVLPVPSSPSSTTTSPARSSAPIARPSACVSSAPCVVVGSFIGARRSRASARLTRTKSARAWASAAPPLRNTADGWSAGISTAPSRYGNSRPRSFVMPSLVSSSSLVAKLPSVTTTRGSMNSTWPRGTGGTLSISSGQRVAVARRAALHDVGDVHLVAGEPDALDEAGEQLPGPAHERLAGEVLLLAGTLADEQQVGVGIADAEHHLRAVAGERALRARERLALEVGERGERKVVRAATRWDPTCQGVARWYATASRIASAVTSVTMHPQAVEVRLDRAGRAPRTRGRRRSGCATGGSHGPGRRARSRASRWHSTLCTGRWSRRRTSVVLVPRPTPPRTARGSGKPGASARRVEPDEQVAVVADHVADRVHHRERADHRRRRRVPTRCPRPPVAPCSAPRHFPTGRRGRRRPGRS